MPELVNLTPFPNFRYYSLDNQGAEFGIIIVKATYQIAPSGQLLIAEEQAPMVFTDACHGAVNVTSLWHPSDLVPHKPRTDVIVNAVARAPGGVARPGWGAGVQVSRDGRVIVEKRIAVTGPRWWVPEWQRDLDDEERREWQKHRGAFKGWRLSEPEPITELPLHYEYAFGGTPQQGIDKDGKPVLADNPFNPLGRGWLNRDWSDHTRPQPAPQIMDGDEQLIDPYALMRPHTLGPIPCAWEPRLPLGGTYDQNWLDAIWPNWPPDYDFAYHNSAHPDLICPSHLIGDEHIQFAGLTGHDRAVGVDLPGHGMAVAFETENGVVELQQMALDTVFLDLAAPSLKDARIYLSWRINFAPDMFEKATLLQSDLAAQTPQEREGRAA